MLENNSFRYNNFDFLRFYFAFVVVIGHMIEISQVDSFQKYSPFFNTYISVTGFFCISGFLISASYSRNKSLKKYFKKRAARILPPYIFIVLICALFLSFVSAYSFQDYFTHPRLYKYLLANLTFLNFIEPCLPGVFTNEYLLNCSVNGALWTLKVEVAFYILVPILLFFMKKVKRKYIILIILYALSIIYTKLFDYLGLYTGNRLFYILSHQLPGFMSYFACGIALHYYFDFFLKNKKWIFLTGITLFVIERILHIGIFTPFALSAIVFTVAYSFNQLNNFGKYGDISYGIYIFHFPIIKLITSLGYFERYNPYLVALSIIIIVLLLGFLSWHLIEKRFLKR